MREALAMRLDLKESRVAVSTNLILIYSLFPQFVINLADGLLRDDD